MTRPSPSRTRAAAYVAAALVLASAVCAGAAAQSGRKAQKPLNLPTEAPKPADPAGKPADSKKPDALYTFVVMKDDTLSVGIDTIMKHGMSRAFIERLKQVGAIEIKDGGEGRRNEAREQARKQEAAYVVFFEAQETGLPSSKSADPYSVVVRTYVYTPKTGDLKYTDTIFQRPYQDTARVGGVRVPVPTRRIQRYPSQLELEQAARDAADRLLSRFKLTPPPEQ